MGVPSFFRWLIDKYPHVLSPVVEDIPLQMTDENGTKVTAPIDLTQPNPNGMEFDALYLDMNGIIHPCCHPDDEEAPDDEDEMLRKIFEVVDRVFAAVRPRKLLFLAIDGPAPRAKMNQQRARRFRAAKDAKKSQDVEEQFRKDMESMGHEVPPKASKEPWDSNVITPGTVFMDKVGKALRWYIHDRMNNDKGWKGIKVILSDANVPGEGEHKVIEYIRLQRLQPDYDPTTRHVIHGLDADLIMLALATHEPYFSILREKIFQGNAREDTKKKEMGLPVQEYQPLDFLHVDILREYLKREFDSTLGAVLRDYDFERVVDDFIFLCFFVGNDFLPHLPSLSIREGAIDLLMRIYNQTRPHMDGYITKDGNVSLKNCQLLVFELGKYEDDIFANRAQRQKRFDARRQRDESFKTEREKSGTTVEAFPLGRNVEQQNRQGSQRSPQVNKRKHEQLDNENMSAAQHIKGEIMSQADHSTSTASNVEDGEQIQASSPKKQKKADNIELVKDLATTDAASDTEKGPMSSFFDKEDETISSAEIEKEKLSPEEEEALRIKLEEYQTKLSEKLKQSAVVDQEQHPDLVQFGEVGWRERYYSSKFHVKYDAQSPDCQNIFRSYLEGLAWVMNYYYKGCRSWTWFYPYHYAPLASDLYSVAHMGEVHFPADKAGLPFRPFDQLMSVLPPESAHALPEPYRHLMLDSDSEIKDFYPDDFKIDLNGAKMEWQGVALLPFIDEERLRKATEAATEKLSQEERRRNGVGNHLLFAHESHALGLPIMKVMNFTDTKEALSMKAFGIAGAVSFYEDHVPIDGELAMTIVTVEPVQDNKVLSAKYFFPPYQTHLTQLLPNCVPPTPHLSDIENEKGRGRIATDSFERFMRGFMGSETIRQRGSFRSGFDSRGSTGGYASGRSHGGHSTHPQYMRDNRYQPYSQHQQQQRSPPQQRYDGRRQHGGNLRHGQQYQQHSSSSSSSSYGHRNQYQQHSSSSYSHRNQQQHQQYPQQHHQQYPQQHQQQYPQQHHGGAYQNANQFGQQYQGQLAYPPQQLPFSVPPGYQLPAPQQQQQQQQQQQYPQAYPLPFQGQPPYPPPSSNDQRR